MKYLHMFSISGMLMFMSASAQAQETYLWLEPQVAVEKNVIGKTKTGEYFGTVSFGYQKSRWLGIFIQSSHGNIWGETVIGPSFQIAEGLNVSLAVGVEHYTPHPIRGRFNAFYDHEASGSFAYVQFDTGKGSNWVWADATRMFKKKVGIGFLAQMPGGGVGPKLELRHGDHLALWVAPVHEWNEKTTRVLTGMRIMFGN